ncbi:hypothetical protein ACVOMV_24155 [Mesorhizobium atlanticum]
MTSGLNSSRNLAISQRCDLLAVMNSAVATSERHPRLHYLPPEPARHLDEKIAGLHFLPGAAIGRDGDVTCFPAAIPQDPVNGIRSQLTAMDRPPDRKRSKRNIPHCFGAMPQRSVDVAFIFPVPIQVGHYHSTPSLDMMLLNGCQVRLRRILAISKVAT